MNQARSIAWLLLSCCLSACGDDDVSPSGDKDAGADSGHQHGEHDAGVRQIDRSGLTDIGTSGRLDYSTPEYWVCRPDIEPNECHRDLDATEIEADGSLAVIEHEIAENPEFDCFYAYPTVWLNQTPQMTDFTDNGVKFVLDPLLSQAARWTSVCRVYAPLYRQAGLSGVTLTAGADQQIALQDVRDAFAYYLEHDNRGRNFVLLGHSQGTFMLESLIKRDIDGNAEVRGRMISAVVLGGQVYTTPGERTGGSFENVPRCDEKGETGCVIHFNAFAKEAPAVASAPLGRVQEVLANDPIDPSGQVVCVDPAKLRDGSERYQGAYFALSLNNPTFGMPVRPAGVTTPFVVYRDLFSGECQFKEGHSYLEISFDPAAGDTRPAPPYRNPTLESVGFGLHLIDWSLVLGDLIDIVKLQAAAMKR